MQLSELLQWLSMGQKTGTLAIRGGAGEKRIYFQNGRIISSSSTIEREYLGHFLVSYGYITEEELTKAMEVQEESKILLGKILVMIGAIAEEDLVELIRLKACETIYDIFLWPEGAFHFIDGEIPQRPMVPIAIDVTGIVMEGLRRFDEWQRLRERIRSMRDVPTVVAPDRESSRSPEPQRIILRAIDGVRSLAEIAEATHNPDFPVAKLVFDLLESGHVELSSEPAAVAPRSSELTPEDPYETVFEEAATPHFEGISDTADELSLPLRLPTAGPRRRRTSPASSAAAPTAARTRSVRRALSRRRWPPRSPAPPPAPPPSTSFRPAPPVSASFRPPASRGSIRATAGVRRCPAAGLRLDPRLRPVGGVPPRDRRSARDRLPGPQRPPLPLRFRSSQPAGAPLRPPRRLRAAAGARRSSSGFLGSAARGLREASSQRRRSRRSRGRWRS